MGVYLRSHEINNLLVNIKSQFPRFTRSSLNFFSLPCHSHQFSLIQKFLSSIYSLFVEFFTFSSAQILKFFHNLDKKIIILIDIRTAGLISLSLSEENLGLRQEFREFLHHRFGLLNRVKRLLFEILFIALSCKQSMFFIGPLYILL